MRINFEKIKLSLGKYISLPLVIAVFCFILLNYIVISGIASQTNMSDESFRIHVVANSNNIDDQKLKYSVKDKITKYINNSIKPDTLSSKEQIKETLSNNIYNILSVAKDEISSDGYNYDVSAKIGKINYSTKISDYYSMPAGSYDAIEITIGNGDGKNWWGLIYPGTLTIPENYFELMNEANEEKPYDKEVNVEFDFKILEVINDLFK